MNKTRSNMTMFFYVYGVKDSRNYDVNSAYGQNVATKMGRREYI